MKRKLISLLVSTAVALLFVSACGGSDTATTTTETTVPETSQTASQSTTEAPIDQSKFYSDVQVYKSVGGHSEYSICWAAGDSITDDDIRDWLVNYVKTHDHNYDIVVFPETEENGIAQGVYSQGVFAQKDVTFSVDGYGQYMLADDSNATIIMTE